MAVFILIFLSTSIYSSDSKCFEHVAWMEKNENQMNTDSL